MIANGRGESFFRCGSSSSGTEPGQVDLREDSSKCIVRGGGYSLTIPMLVEPSEMSCLRALILFYLPTGVFPFLMLLEYHIQVRLLI